MTNAPANKLRLASATALGSEVVGFALVGVLIDYTLGTLQSIPWATLILSPLGLVVAMIHLLKLVKPEAKA
ncbi:hypothetical protein [Limnoglobus roseus]|uniref:AtpZ/AtpI family protein n=1 Tax=Limnoglobus roseus TaxID=2598579 RepID=A0A5C1AFZ5_9BACT|nr:hypothetical protein [Limnoglobus roseus]QEL17047.1 hypothetical protein PX52LOC_04023 [Limnoglobus roseus]